MRRLRHVLGWMADRGVRLGLALLGLMAVLVVAQVAVRNFLGIGLPWADELARFCLIGLVFLSVPALAGRQELVSVTVLRDRLGPRAARRFRLLGDVATLALGVMLLLGLAEFLPKAGKFLTPAMHVPNWFYYSLALVGSLFLSLVALDRVLATLFGADPAGPYEGEASPEASDTT